MNLKDRKFSAVDEAIVRAALASNVSFPSSVAAVKLISLNSNQLCQLFDHCYLYNLEDVVNRNNLTGIHLEDAIDSIQDLLDLGIDKLTAKVLLKRIAAWKEDGLPEDFYPTPRNVASAASGFWVAPVTPPVVKFPGTTYVVEKELDDDYIVARYCRDRTATDRIVTAAENGNHLAEAYLSSLYVVTDALVGFDRAKAEAYAVHAMPWLQDSAGINNMFAQFNLAMSYLNGRGVVKNQKEALRYFNFAADQGHVGAIYSLGVCYSNGTGVTKNEVEAMRYYKLAAEQGHVGAQNNLGSCYEYGAGVAKDQVEAARLYQLAADKGNAQAQCNLGVCCEQGIGVTKDESETVKYFQLAADQGLARAQFNLGVCYVRGTGVARNLVKAMEYFNLAVNQGHANAQFNMGKCYEYGWGVSMNKNEAIKYYKLAAAQKYMGAQCKVDLLEKESVEDKHQTQKKNNGQDVHLA